MNRVLVIGSTGTVSALVRNPEAAGLLSEVEVVRGDLTVPESLDACLDGIDTYISASLKNPTPLLSAAQSGSNDTRTNRATH
jgi:uncharacterized protein YbjT (DUF2867 family)